MCKVKILVQSCNMSWSDVRWSEVDQTESFSLEPDSLRANNLILSCSRVLYLGHLLSFINRNFKSN